MNYAEPAGPPPNPEFSTVAVIRWDAAFRVVGWSSAAESIFGYRFEEVMGRTPGEIGLVHPDDAERVTATANRVFSGEIVGNVSTNLNLTKSGDVVRCSWHNSYLPLDDTFCVVSLVQRRHETDIGERFRSLFEHNADAILLLDLEGRIVHANAASERALAYPIERLVGMHYTQCIAANQTQAARRSLASILQGDTLTIAFNVMRADDSIFESEITGAPLIVNGQLTGAYAVIKDVSAQRRTERALGAQAERLRELYLVAAATGPSAGRQIEATIAAGCRLLDMTCGALYDAAADRTAASHGGSVSTRLQRLPLGTQGTLAIDDVRGLPWIGDDPGSEAVAYIGTRIDVGGARYGTLSFISRTVRREPFAEIDRDLVQLMGALIGGAIERRQSRAHLKTLAYYDALTGLPNRTRYFQLLERALAERRSERYVAVMFLDLDRFKDINDTQGHAHGDVLLRIIGQRLSHTVGERAIVARMGGDEFIALVRDIESREQMVSLAERTLASIDEPILIEGLDNYITTSIGIALYPDDGADAETLVKHADIAMYRAKERGRNRYQFFTAALNAATTTRLDQEKRMRSALERGDFVLYYQPQFELATGRLCGAEALARWQHPERGLIMPEAFIPSAEQSGLIVALGDFIFGAACEQLVRWQALGFPDLRVAINLSARQFHRTGMVDTIQRILTRTGAPPRQIEVEITESVAMSDVESSSAIMRDLEATGVRIALDDFGTGYSSLGYLRRYPLDALKIDQSFVRDILEEPDDATIVKTVIGMAHSLGLEVVAEGVEQQGQLEFLRREGCDIVQGHLFSKALPPDEFAAFLKSR